MLLQNYLKVCPDFRLSPVKLKSNDMNKYTIIYNINKVITVILVNVTTLKPKQTMKVKKTYNYGQKIIINHKYVKLRHVLLFSCTN